MNGFSSGAEGAIAPAQRGFGGELSMLVREADADQHGRGILFHAARDVQPSDVLKMVGQGGICVVTINEPLALRLALYPQTRQLPDGEAPYFVSSVEARACRETGISAHERALTIRTLGSAGVRADDIATPGHVMVEVAPNIMREGASLSELANLFLAASTDTRYAAWSDILNEKGDLATAAECIELASTLGMPVYSATEVSAYGRTQLKPWLDTVEFSKSRFGG